MSANRYQKHIKLNSFGQAGQEKLAQSSVLIIGAGGLGTPAAQYLNGIGVGTLGLMDNDIVNESNLARQTLYSPSDIGRSKTTVLVQRLQQQNPATRLINIQEFLTPDNALATIADYDLIIDASDNFGTRYLVNDACVILDKPFIYGALHDFEGQVSVLNYQEGPTYRCLFPEASDTSAIRNCDENGVLGVLPALIGTYQAIEAVKILTGIGEPLVGKLLLIDTLSQNHLKIGVPSLPQNKVISKLKSSYHQTVCVPKADLQELSPRDFLELMRNEENIQLVDVRTELEFHQNPLENARNIPLHELESRHQEIDASKKTVLICQSGKRSLQAGTLLKEIYPESRIFNLTGGLNHLKTKQEE
ncbi:molybdopterin-synthase adenylyltransferase MoeB [Echinicola sediminis]